MRHRAQLFVAQVDHERLRVVRETQRILIPERGTPLGKFCVTEIYKSESWVTDL
ncbi:MAG: hypothetical protein RMK18_09510 [Armatimonadota bacterium]|nr:hypothetical protein [Armatimonadota bacterium]